MVKHMLRTNALLTLHIKSFIVQSPCLFFSCMRTVLQKKKKKEKDDTVSMTVLLSSAFLGWVQRYCISIATEVCSLLLSVEWFFMTLNMKESPVSVLYALSLWPAVVSSPSRNWKLQPVGALLYFITQGSHVFIIFTHSWKFRSTI